MPATAPPKKAPAQKGSNWGRQAGELSSDWTGLSLALFAKIEPVDFSGNPIAGSIFVRAPYTEGELEVSANWASVHENAGVESLRPALAAAAQSGDLMNLTAKLSEKAPAGLLQALGVDVQSVLGTMAAMQGRSGITKINSRQTYSGSAPVKIPLTLKFRAFSEPKLEVEDPVQQLFLWALPQSIAGGSLASAALSNNGNSGILENLLPSKMPTLLRLELGWGDGRRSYSPVVIESVSHPIKTPRGVNGEMLNVDVRLQLATLTAMDVADWKNRVQNVPIKLKS
jgi:hypothetical protein